MKKFEYRLNSIQKKFFACFLMILLLFLLILTFLQSSSKTMNDRYNGMMEKLFLLNDVYTEMDAANISMQRYMEYDLPEDYSNYEAHQSTLSRLTSRLDSLEETVGYSRELVDLKNMLSSFIENADEVTEMKKSYVSQNTDSVYLTNLNETYSQAQQVYSLINSSFKDVYSIVLKESADVQARTDSISKLLSLVNIVMIVFALSSCAIFFSLFSRYVTEPIRTLTEFARKVSRGEMQLEPPHIKSNDEMKILSEVFDSMMVTINRQISEIEQDAKIKEQLQQAEVRNLQTSNMLKAAEFKALQSRINPHFLFNMLNMISQTAYLEGADRTIALIDSTADLLRYNLDKLSKSVTIGDEIENVKNYVFIQEQRFGSRITFRFEFDKSLGKQKIPCLVLQPLVENSIRHGVGIYISGGIISVKVQRNGDRILLTVQDNGIGMEPEQLERLLRGLEESGSDNQEQLGLKNVQMRLKLFYNNDVVTTIKSVPKKDTEVTFSIPDWGDSTSTA
jgi:two-component system sensor histidine kinase YesM